MRASGSVVLGAAGALFHVLVAPRFYNYPKILVYVLAVPALWAFADRQSLGRLALIAAVTAVGFLFRHDHGVFIAAAFAVLLAAMTGVSWGTRLRHAAGYGLLVIALLSPYLLFIQINGGVVTYFRTAAAWAERDRDRAPVVWPGLFDNPDGVSPAAHEGRAIRRVVAVVQDNATAWLFYAELLLPLLAGFLWMLSPHAFRPRWPNARTKLAAVIALAALLDAGFLRSPLAARLADPSVPHAILIAWLIVAALRLTVGADVREAWRRRSWFVPATAAGLALSAALLFVLASAATADLPRRLEKAYLNQTLDDALDRAGSMWTRIGQSFPIPDDPAPDPDDLVTLSLYLRQCTQPTDRIFVEQYIPQVLALAERGFAGGHADLRPGFFTTEDMQRLTVERLRAQSVPVALVGGEDDLDGFRRSFPIVMAYFDRQFQNVAEHTFDGRFAVRLLVNRSAHATGRYAPLGWPCFRS
jgi:hypothetical protein